MNDSTIETPVSFAVEQLKTIGVCKKETVTFDKLPEAVGYLTEQVIELKKMVAELQPQPSDKHVLVEIDDACHIIRKAKPTIYTYWYAKGYFRLTRKARNSISMRTSFLLGLRTDGEKLPSRHTKRCFANMQSGVRHKPKSSVQF